MNAWMYSWVSRINVFLLLILCNISTAFAAPTGGGSLPWEEPLSTVSESFTGPVALAISLLGIVVAGGMLIFGGELDHFTRRVVLIVFVLALLVGASALLEGLFGSTGAVLI